MSAKARNDEGGIGLSLYALTLLLDLGVAAPARFVLAWLVLAPAGLFRDLPGDLGLSALAVALLPNAYSLMGVLLLGNGQLWRRKVGAREPTGEEQQRFRDAMAMLASYSSEELPHLELYVIDLPFACACTRGRAVIVSRVLLYEEGLAAKLGHEYGHVLTWDGRLTEALHRLDLWTDPLRGGTDSAAAESGVAPAAGGRGAWAFGGFRLLVRFAGGAPIRFLLQRPWSWYWREREFAADMKAASLGQGEDLRRHLEERELLLDGPQEWLKRGRYDHPYVAERVDRLRAFAEAGSWG